MSAQDFTNISLKQASELLEKGEISVTDLTNQYLERIKKTNPELNAYITVLEKEALTQAKESDKRLQKNARKSALDGVPIAVKDNMTMEGMLTTAGSKILENFYPPYDATVISKLKNAGAVILGKTNMDEFAMGSSTETSYFGPTKNPHDITRVPGGSSGGSAAAVAAGLCAAALGSDTGGSIRQPAALCGIVGFKPTYGLVSRYGLFAMASSLDQIGPMTRGVEDVQILFDIIRGYDEKDSTSINPKSAFRQVILNPKQILNSKLQIQNIKIGVPKEYFGEGIDEKVKKSVMEAIEKLKNLGAEIIDITLPNQKYALSCYYIIMPVEVASNLARYDGIKYGYSANGNLLETYINSRSEGFGKEAKRRIILGTYASSAGYIDQYYNKAQKVRALIKKDFDRAFKKVDFILGPTAPETAFKIGEKVTDPLKMYLSDIYTIAVNLAGLPAISVPCGLVDPPSGGLPVGLQIIGPQFSDDAVLNLAKIYEGARNGISGA